MEGLDRGERLAPFFRVREGCGFFEGFLTGADCLGKPVLIEFGRLRLPPARGCLRGDGDRLEARFREGERRSRRAQGLEADLLQGMSKEPALELDAGLSGAFAILEFVQGGFRAVDENFVVDDRGVEGCDEFEEIGLAFEEVGEEIGILAGQGSELVESVCLASSSWLSAQRGSRVMTASSRRGPGGTRRTGGSPGCGSSPDAGNSKWGA